MDWFSSEQLDWLVKWVAPPLLGFVSGIAGSLLAPWIHWKIEKQRAILLYRQNLIADWRSKIDSFDWNKEDFGDSSTYAALRIHMTPDMRLRFEKPRTSYVMSDDGRGSNLKKQWASDEVSRLEKEWGLS